MRDVCTFAPDLSDFDKFGSNLFSLFFLFFANFDDYLPNFFVGVGQCFILFVRIFYNLCQSWDKGDIHTK